MVSQNVQLHLEIFSLTLKGMATMMLKIFRKKSEFLKNQKGKEEQREKDKAKIEEKVRNRRLERCIQGKVKGSKAKMLSQCDQEHVLLL